MVSQICLSYPESVSWAICSSTCIASECKTQVERGAGEKTGPRVCPLGSLGPGISLAGGTRGINCQWFSR